VLDNWRDEGGEVRRRKKREIERELWCMMR